MKVILAVCLVFLSSSCATRKSGKRIMGFEQFDDKTIVYIDYLSRDKIPDVLMRYYYGELDENDFYEPQIIVSTSDGTRAVHLNSKPAKSGFLYITKYSADFVAQHENTIFVVNRDTIDSREGVMGLIRLDRAKVMAIDTVNGIQFNAVIVKRKQ